MGNVYVQFREEEHAANALKNLSGRYYAGKFCLPLSFFSSASCIDNISFALWFFSFKSITNWSLCSLLVVQNSNYTGRPIIVDFSPVTDFREATCRQYEENNCNRGGYCNFMHLKRIGRLVSLSVSPSLLPHKFI